MSENKPPGFHRCRSGVVKIEMPATAEIATFGTTAALRLESPGHNIAMAVEINACPFCLEPLSTAGRTLDRMKRVEGLK